MVKVKNQYVIETCFHKLKY